MRAVDIIIKKRNGIALSYEEINFMIEGLVKGLIPDYQMSALLMAIYFKGTDLNEQFALTKAILHSGEVIDLSSIEGICVDKHSTGGVGDKTSLVIGPLAASCGLKMAKMSGRGLGHTGGTLDKLEAIPSFDINISQDDFFLQVNKIGLAIVGQTANLTPADKLLYALRDVTGTVDSIGLIASSVMSKKLASGAHTIILDVKVGDGAFMKTQDEAKALAKVMVDIGKSFNRKLIAVLTDMDEPLGDMIGNSLEVIEAIEVLKGRGSASFRKLCILLTSELLLATGIVKTLEEGNALLEEKIKNGDALEKFREMIKYQKGDPRVIDDYSLFGTAKEKIVLKASKSGYIHRLEALKVGKASMLLGAGREEKNQAIDFVVGIELVKKVGDYVNNGDILAYVYTNGKSTQEAINLLKESYHIKSEEVEKRPLILEIIK